MATIKGATFFDPFFLSWGCVIMYSKFIKYSAHLMTFDGKGVMDFEKGTI
jgi:hypothetical protein